MNRVLLVLAIIVLAVASSLGATAQIAEQSAQIGIQQPAYVDQDVQQLSVNGTPVYVVAGERINIKPENFDLENVVDYGVDSEAGRMELDDSIDTFVFDPESTNGTFKIYWVVNRQVESDSANGTQTVTTRYVARVRVTGQTNLIHSDAAAIDQFRIDAENWREWNETIHSDRVAGPGADTGQVLNRMIAYFRLAQNPLRALTGNFTGVIIVIVTTFGGFLFWALWQGYHIAVVTLIRRRLNIFESVERDEGELADRKAAFEHSERIRALQNLDWYDIFNDDHVAAAFANQFGETVLDGWETFQELILPRNLVRDRLQAMSQAGYVALVDETTDGDQDNQTIESAHLVREERLTAEEKEQSVSLVEPDDDLLAAIDYADPQLISFDLPSASVDLEQLDTTLESMDLDSLIERLDADLTDFSDTRVYGEYIQQFALSVRDHEITDATGRPDSTRYLFNEFLKASQLVSDRYQFPYADYVADAIERAILDFRPGQRAEKDIERINEGSGLDV